MTGTLSSCMSPISFYESDRLVPLSPPVVSGSPSLSSSVGRIPHYNPLEYKPLDFPRFDSPSDFGGSSSLRSGIGKIDFSGVSSLFNSHYGGSPSLDSALGKIDFSKIDFSSSGKAEESPSQSLTVLDFPNSGFQVHIHEGAGGSANVKPYSQRSMPLVSSYDAAMLDLDFSKSSPKSKSKIPVNFYNNGRV